jgi:hypothetical protein
MTLRKADAERGQATLASGYLGWRLMAGRKYVRAGQTFSILSHPEGVE